MDFLLATYESNVSYCGILGLGYQYRDNNFNLVQKLKESNLTNKIMYSQVPSKINKDEGKIIFGDYPYNVKEKMKIPGKVGSCNLNSFLFYKNVHYQCIMDGYFRGKEENIVEDYLEVVFDTGSNYTLLDYGYFETLVNNYLGAYIGNSNICQISSRSSFIFDFNFTDPYRYVFCSNEIFSKNIPPLNLVFNKWAISIKIEDLFIPYRDSWGKIKNISLIVGYRNEVSNNIIAQPILNKIISIFNAEESKFEFTDINEENLYIKELSKDYSLGRKYFYIIEVCIISAVFLISLIVFVVLRVKKTKKDSKEGNKYIEFSDAKSNHSSIY